MEEWLIEFTLSVCVCLCIPDSCPTHKLLCMVGFKNNWAQMIIKTRRCVVCKNHVPSSKVKVTVLKNFVF